MPFQFMQPYLDSAPSSVPRPLKRPKADKAGDFMSLAQLLLSRFPSDTSGRMVEFLLEVVRQRDPTEVPPVLNWFSNARKEPLVIIGKPSMASILAPTVKFQAQFLRR